MKAISGYCKERLRAVPPAIDLKENKAAALNENDAKCITELNERGWRTITKRRILQ
jgi:hypothetical protein